MKAELRSLPRSLADLVAQHLVASGRFVDDDPERAYQHAKTARRLAARLGAVREAVAVTAYLAEHYDEALTEFRAVRRMTGNQDVLPAMADCERALGRPEKALALSRDRAVINLELPSRIEMLIVAAGARRDMKQYAAAVQALEIPELTKRTRADWMPRVRYAYADALLDAGRRDDALEWFHRAAGVDTDGLTDAAERAADLEGLTFTDLDDSPDPDTDENPADVSDADADADADVSVDAPDISVADAESADDADADASVDVGDADADTESADGESAGASDDSGRPADTDAE